MGSNDDDIVTGHDDTILVGSNSILTARGSALSVQVIGAGSVVRIGGNGVDASNADDNVVVFNGVGGALHELANARVDVTAAHTRLTMAGDDALGVYGRGDTVTASGVDDAIWIGQNGFGMTGGAIDFVNSLTYGAVFEMAGSTVSTNGAYYAVTLAARDMLTATGLGVNVTITGRGRHPDHRRERRQRLEHGRGRRPVSGGRYNQSVRRQPRRHDGKLRHGEFGERRHVRPLRQRRHGLRQRDRRPDLDRAERHGLATSGGRSRARPHRWRAQRDAGLGRRRRRNELHRGYVRRRYADCDGIRRERRRNGNEQLSFGVKQPHLRGRWRQLLPVRVRRYACDVGRQRQHETRLQL